MSGSSSSSNWPYRVAVGALVALVAIDYLVPVSFWQPSLQVFDVAADVRDQMVGPHDWLDKPIVYYLSDTASAHLHLMAPGQTCPNHFHRSSDETVIIALGTADVSHAWGENGEKKTSGARFGEGSLIHSPVRCGHEWMNTTEQGLGNLVFESPPFDGNLYVKPADERLLAGRAPETIDIPVELRAFEASGETSRTRELHYAGDRLALVFARSSMTLSAATAIVGYVVAGAGRVDASWHHAVIAPHSVFVARKSPVGITPTSGTLALVVLRDRR